jgi:hypothetical protein
MTSPRTYVYKILKGAWGIRISLTAEAVRSTEPNPGAIGFGSRMWLSSQIEGDSLSESDMEMLAQGLRLLVDEIGEAVSHEPLVVVLQDLQYVESDFQPEGLAAAMFGWAIEEFELRPREIDVTFDRETNQYNFAWPGREGT